MRLRDYQSGLISEARQALGEVNSVLIQSATGSGKTALSAFMAGSAAKRGKRVIFGVHRKELVKQTAKTFRDVGIPFGIIAAGFTGDRHQLVQIASVQTLASRRERYGVPDLYIPDEAHHASAKTWSETIEAYAEGGAKIVGLSATPERLDGTGLGKWFQRMVNGPSVEWLIDQGYLAPYKMFAPGAPDLSGIKKTGGDLNRGALAERMGGTAITGNAVEHYRRIGHGMRAMVFCVSIKHSLSVVEQFQAAGYRAAHIDGTSPNRDELIADFTSGKIQVLSSVDLVSEGFDLPAMEVALLLRPTYSLSLYLQQCLDDETEILTRRGWLRRSDISESDDVAAFNTTTGVAEWRGINRKIERTLSSGEKMFGIESPHLNIRVTGGHDMVVRNRSKTSKNWRKESAETASRRASMWRVPVSGISAIPDDVSVSDDELRLIGWFLTDGTRNKITNAVSISQSSAKPEHCAEIRRVMEACGLKFGECEVARTGDLAHCPSVIHFTTSKGAPRGRDKHLSGWAHLGKWLDKSMGAAFDGLSARQIGVLLGAMNLGDGANGRKTITWTPATMSIACGDNERMADRLQALCVMRGFRCNKAVYEANGHGPWWTLHIRPAEYATIAGAGDADGAVDGKSYRRSRFNEVESKPGEIVWCVENDLGTLFVRRRGKVSVVGNCGRVLRPVYAPGYDLTTREGRIAAIAASPKPWAYILDHAGNSIPKEQGGRGHGLPDEDREWSLQGRPKRTRKAADEQEEKVPVRQCPNCYRVHPPAPACPKCGHEYPTMGRTVEELAGELQEVDKSTLRKMQKTEERAAKTLEDLIDIGRARGYAKPEGWARMYLKAREGRKATRYERA